MMYPQNNRVFAPENGGQAAAPSGGTPGASSGNGATPPAETPQWAKDLQESIKGLGGSLAAIGQHLSQAGADRAAAADAAKRAAAPPEPDSDDLEGMSRSEFGQYLLNKVSASLDEHIVKPFNSKLGEITAQATRSDLTREVERLRGQHKDFNDWKDEMIALAKEQPNLPLEKIYKLVRAENTTKSSELDKKYAPKSDDGSRGLKVSFGGLLPNGSGEGGARGRNMKPSQAAESAWTEVVTALGGEPIFGE